jgi:hypothetical protein
VLSQIQEIRKKLLDCGYQELVFEDSQQHLLNQLNSIKGRCLADDVWKSSAHHGPDQLNDGRSYVFWSKQVQAASSIGIACVKVGARHDCHIVCCHPHHDSA